MKMSLCADVSRGETRLISIETFLCKLRPQISKFFTNPGMHVNFNNFLNIYHIQNSLERIMKYNRLFLSVTFWSN